MGGMKVNFAEVEGGFETLPEGTYECVIEAATMRQSDNSEYPYINLELKVLDDEYEDRRVWLGTSLSPKALGFTKDKLVALGVIEEDDELEFEWDDDLDIGPSEGPALIEPELVGLACTVRTVNRLNDGKESQDAWRSEIVDGGGSPAPAKKSSSKKNGASRSGGSKGKGKRTRKLR